MNSIPRDTASPDPATGLPGGFPGGPPPLTPLRPPERNLLSRASGPGLIVLLSIVAIMATLFICYVHYERGQDPHRLVKMIIGLLLAAFFITQTERALYLLPFAFPYSTWLPKSGVPMLNGVNLILLSLVIGWAGKSLGRHKRFSERTPWDVPVFVFLAWMTFSWLRVVVLDAHGAGAVLRSFQQFWGAIVGLLLFFVVINNLRNWDQIRNAALAVCVGMAVGIGGLYLQLHSYGGGRRVSGGFGQENIAGAFYASAALFTLGLLTAGYRGLLRKALLGLSLVGAGVAMILTGSRGAIVGFLAGGLPQVLRGGMIWLLVLILFVTGTLLWAPDYIKERFVHTQSAVTAESDERYDALNHDSGGRLDFWKASLQVIASHALLGVGFGRMGSALQPYIGEARPPHNLYLEVAGEMGIPGLLLLLFLLFTAWRYAGELLRYPGFPGALGIAYRSSLAALVVCNLFGGRLFDFSLLGSLAFTTALVFRSRALLLEEAAATAAGARGRVSEGVAAGVPAGMPVGGRP